VVWVVPLLKMLSIGSNLIVDVEETRSSTWGLFNGSGVIFTELVFSMFFSAEGPIDVSQLGIRGGFALESFVFGAKQQWR
jgi:hypothetical protein